MNRNRQNAIKHSVRTLTLLVGLATAMWHAEAVGAAYPYSNANDLWNKATTWTANGGTTPPSTPNDYAYVARGYTVTLQAGDSYTINACGIGHSSIGGNNTLPGTLNMTGGSLTLNTVFNVGESRGGTFNQSGGAVSVGSDATLGCNYTGSGQSDAWNLSGGTVTITGKLQVGFFSQANTGVADATFNQTGGVSTVSITGNLVIGSTHSASATKTFAYNLGSGGTLTVGGIVTNNTYGTNNLTFNGGTLKAGNTQANFMSRLTHAYVSTNGAVLDSNGKNIGISQVLEHAGPGTDGGLTKLGGGTLTLSGTSTYNGATVISNGTLTIASSGSISNSARIAIAAGATNDVSAFSTYTLSTNTILRASGTAAAPAVLKGGTTVSLGSQAVTLDFTPATYSGDTASPALTVSQGSLTLNGVITVNILSIARLGAGTYRLISQTSGSIAGTPMRGATTNLLLNNSGVVSGGTARIEVSGGQVNLIVAAAAIPSTVAVTRHLGTAENTTYGDSLSFDIAVTPNSPTVPTGLVFFLKDGGAAGTVLGSHTLVTGENGICTITPALNALTAGSHANIVAVYAGDNNFADSVSAALSTQTVVRIALTINGAATSNKFYDGTAIAPLTGTLSSGVLSGDTVTLTLSAQFADAMPGTGKDVTSTSTLDNPNYSLTQPAGLKADIVAAAVWTSLASGNWSTAANWQNNAIGYGIGSTNDFSTLDITTDTSVHLDSPRTVGHLRFNDTDAVGTAAGWTLDNNGFSTNVLTLGVYSGSATIDVGALGADKSVTISAVVAGSSPLNKTGAGKLTLTGANTHSGGMTISTGTVQLGDGTTGHDGSLASGITNNAALVYNLYGSQTASYGVSGAGGSITKTGPGTLILNGTHTYTGTYVVNGGVLNPATGNYASRLASGSSLVVNNGGRVEENRINSLMGGNNVAVTINAGGVMAITASVCSGLCGPLTLAGGTLSASGYLDAVNGSWSFAQNVAVTGGVNTSVISAPYVALLKAGGVTFNVAPGATNGIDLLVSGFFSGSRELIKTGTGFMALNGVNLYTNNTTVSAGMLGGTGVVTGLVSVAAQGVICGGVPSAPGTLKVAALTLAPGATLACTGNAVTQSLVAVTGALSLPTAATVQLTFQPGAVQPKIITLCTFASCSATASDLAGWTRLGDAPGKYYLELQPNALVLRKAQGTMIKFF
ncbi:MAG: autotransporter-associated beta strand repeat-containing protein [bacterium]